MQEMDVLSEILVRMYYTIRNFIIYPYLAMKDKKLNNKIL